MRCIATWPVLADSLAFGTIGPCSPATEEMMTIDPPPARRPPLALAR
jgi:hypothetical protein